MVPSFMANDAFNNEQSKFNDLIAHENSDDEVEVHQVRTRIKMFNTNYL